jgi:solute carrier family 15 (peptide/histidine transporter), member 3/4
LQASPLFPDALALAREERPNDALDAAGSARGYSAEQVEEVRAVLRLLPVFFLSISYWTIYTQMASVFVLQVLMPCANHVRSVAVVGLYVHVLSWLTLVI